VEPFLPLAPGRHRLAPLPLRRRDSPKPWLEPIYRIVCGHPAANRANDFYFHEPSGDVFWDSEYFYESAPAKFRCSFLIHLEPVDRSHTTVEIFEYQPYVWAGEYFGFSAHAILPRRSTTFAPWNQPLPTARRFWL